MTASAHARIVVDMRRILKVSLFDIDDEASARDLIKAGNWDDTTDCQGEDFLSLVEIQDLDIEEEDD